MSERNLGRKLAISPARAMVLELLHHARQVPSLPLAKTMNLGLLPSLRKAAGATWTSLFTKAYSLAAVEHPELRRSYIPYPTRHLYEHPHSSAAILVERNWQDENVVLGGRLRAPEERSIADIDQVLKGFRENPVWDVTYFRQALRVGRLPGFVRRFLFWHSLYLSGEWRARRFGTFMVSSLGSLGVEQFHPLTFLTTYLTYGPIDASGDVTVKVIYDHRVLDGRTVARALGTLEEMLKGPIVAEIAQLASLRREPARSLAA